MSEVIDKLSPSLRNKASYGCTATAWTAVLDLLDDAYYHGRVDMQEEACEAVKKAKVQGTTREVWRTWRVIHGVKVLVNGGDLVVYNRNGGRDIVREECVFGSPVSRILDL